MNIKKHEPNIWLFITVSSLAIINCEYCIMEVEDYGVKKSWDGWRTLPMFVMVHQWD
jgi:hypothetical protein